MEAKTARRAGLLHNQFVELLVQKRESLTSLQEAVALLCDHAFQEKGEEPAEFREVLVDHLAAWQPHPLELKDLPPDLAGLFSRFRKSAVSARSPRELDGAARSAFERAERLDGAERYSALIYLSIFTESASFWFRQLREGPRYSSFTYHVWTDWTALAQYDAEVAFDFYRSPVTRLARFIWEPVTKAVSELFLVEAAIVGALYSWLAYERHVFQRTVLIPNAPTPTPPPVM